MRIAAGLILASLVTASAGAVARPPAPQADTGLKAAFIFNFAKFTEWPALSNGAPIVACIYGDDGIAAALEETVRGQNISGHSIEVQVSKESTAFRLCQLVFVGAAETRRAQAAVTGVGALPVLTVSDGKGFAQTGGIIELYAEDGRIRFAINVTAVERSGLHLSSRLLGLARIVRGGDAP